MPSIEKENNNNTFTLLSFSRERLISTSQVPTSHLPPSIGSSTPHLIRLIHLTHVPCDPPDPPDAPDTLICLIHLDLGVHMELCVRICTLP